MTAAPPAPRAGGRSGPDGCAGRDVDPAAPFFSGLLGSGCAEERVVGIERWTKLLGGAGHLVPLLDDDAPLVRLHRGGDHLVEVRAVALVALQERHRSAGGWPYGPVTVRRALPAEQATRDADRLLADHPDARHVRAGAEHWLDARVDPPPADRDACLAYAVLRVTGALAYHVQDVDPVSLLTPLQEEVHAGQLPDRDSDDRNGYDRNGYDRDGDGRPRPHLRLTSSDGRTAGFLHAAPWQPGGLALDVDESPAARDALSLLTALLRHDVMLTVHPDDAPGRLRLLAAMLDRSAMAAVAAGRRLPFRAVLVEDDGPAGPGWCRPGPWTGWPG